MVNIRKNAQGDVLLPAQDIQVHAYGRALAHTGQWTIIGEPQTLATARSDGFARHMVMEHTDSGERRHILSYTVFARRGSPFIMQLNASLELEWGQAHIPDELADHRTHRLYTVCVQRVGKHGLLKPELSKATRYAGMLQRLRGQKDMAETLHPFDLMPKDAITALMAFGKDIAVRTTGPDETRRLKEVAATFRKAEFERLA